MGLRHIGYWDGPYVTESLPDVCAFVSEAAVQRSVVDYLRSGTAFAWQMGVSRCRLCGAANGSAELTDGVHFVWPEGLAHYVEAHHVQLPADVTTVAARGPAAAVDPPAVDWDAIDDAWWGGLADTPVDRHLTGCRHSEQIAAWDLPRSADVWVDGLPADGVKTLAQLRTLLGAAWPISDLRRLLGTQPFLAVAAGNPAKLHRALTRAAALRPYLFYATPTGLRPVRPQD